jgi:signal peptidase
MNLPSGLPRRAAHVVGVLLLIAAVVPFAVYAVPETVGASESYIVLTASMAPAIASGDAVLVREVPAEAVAPGDVVTFQPRAGDVPVTHRVVDVVVLSDGTRTFVTKGDANEDRDAGLVTPAMLVGEVTVVVPYVGHVVAFVDSPVGFAALVGVPVGLLIATEVAGLVLSARADRREPTEPVADAEPPADGSIVLTRADLTFTAVSLGAFTAYAASVAWAERTALAVAVVVGVAATFTLVVALRSAIPADDPAPDDGGPETDDAARSGSEEVNA